MTSNEVLPRKELGSTGLKVTGICIGGSPLGSSPENFGYEVTEQRGIETARYVLNSPLNFLDTSNCYGSGRSEERIGRALTANGGMSPEFVLATKVDAEPGTGRFDAARVRRSAEESLERLGLDRIQLLYLHDPEDVITFEEAMGPGGAVEGLLALREEGLAEHIGVAAGPVDLLSRFVRTGAFEVLLTHNRFTLVDRSAEGLIAEASSAGLGVVNAAVYGGGILARGTSYTNNYAYRPASDEVLGRIAQIEGLCADFGLPLRAAALHWSLRDPRIHSTIIGTASIGHVDELIGLMEVVLPDDLWHKLDPLAAPKDEWLW